jgi:predicted transcriptional regulator
LPAQFDKAKYIEVATQLQIPESTADKQIARFLNAGLLIKQTHGKLHKRNSVRRCIFAVNKFPLAFDCQFVEKLYFCRKLSRCKK